MNPSAAMVVMIEFLVATALFCYAQPRRRPFLAPIGSFALHFDRHQRFDWLKRRTPWPSHFLPGEKRELTASFFEWGRL